MYKSTFIYLFIHLFQITEKLVQTRFGSLKGRHRPYLKNSHILGPNHEFIQKKSGSEYFFHLVLVPLKMNSSHFPNSPIYTCPLDPFYCYSVNFVASEEVFFLSVTVFSAVFRSIF